MVVDIIRVLNGIWGLVKWVFDWSIGIKGRCGFVFNWIGWFVRVIGIDEWRNVVGLFKYLYYFD